MTTKTPRKKAKPEQPAEAIAPALEPVETVTNWTQTEQAAPALVTVYGPEGVTLHLSPEPITFEGGKAQMPLVLAQVLVSDPANRGRFLLKA